MKVELEGGSVHAGWKVHSDPLRVQKVYFSVSISKNPELLLKRTESEHHAKESELLSDVVD
jgi:hypothetical protein